LHYLRHIVVLLLVSLSFIAANAQQPQFSLNIDVGVLRSFREGQQFWAPGQTVAGHFHLSPKNGAYIFLNYHLNGKFSNHTAATAKLPATSPQQIPYTNKADLDFLHISIGWKRYITGAYYRDAKSNLYAYAGLGLMMAKVANLHSVHIDTADYVLPVASGEGKFKRLTIDPGIGYERSFGGDVFFYIEGRSLIPISNYPSPYLLVNGYVPVSAAVHLGIRIFFE
jgi:hypothetical protein